MLTAHDAPHNPHRNSGTATLLWEEIESFKDQWPCNGLPELESITFEYDSRGDLVDILAIDINGRAVDIADFDGPALLALSQDAQRKAS